HRLEGAAGQDLDRVGGGRERAEQPGDQQQAHHVGVPITYGFSAAYMNACVGVGTPSWRPSSTTLPPSHGSSMRLPRWRSSAIDGFMVGGAPALKASMRSSVSAGSLTPRALPTAITSW